MGHELCQRCPACHVLDRLQSLCMLPAASLTILTPHAAMASHKSIPRGKFDSLCCRVQVRMIRMPCWRWGTATCTAWGCPRAVGQPRCTTTQRCWLSLLLHASPRASGRYVPSRLLSTLMLASLTSWACIQFMRPLHLPTFTDGQPAVCGFSLTAHQKRLACVHCCLTWIQS